MKRLTRGEAIRAFCRECMGGGRTGSRLVPECEVVKCPLWTYRLGKEVKRLTNAP